ncbi:MAG: cyclic nucleotide-binding domain-containing protein [Actinobacteria bacterium]|nr:cyclic nucleotide-binding domain-containing protein [Actinomycetota bacterium]
MSEKKELVAELARHPFMRGFAPEAVERMAECVEGIREWDEDALIFRAGGEADMCYLVRGGEVAIEIHSPGVGSRIVQTVSHGQVLGWSWLFEPHQWAFDARVLTPASAFVLRGEAVRKCMDEHHDLGYLMMSRFAGLIAARLQATRLQLLDLYASRD